MTLPSGTVTFLFTDIEGSTKLWETQPDAMRISLALHDLLLRDAIERNNGYVFKTVGDAFCAAFHTVPEALKAALEAQLALQNQQWDGHIGALRARMGLHTGEAEERDNDYFGPALNRTARLQGVAYGQQTLLTQTTYELVANRLPDNSRVGDLGLHRLKDLAAPEHIWQLLHPSLPQDFAPLKTLDYLPNNLPRQLTSFIGREKEMAEIELLMEKTSLLTLTGSGGCGKTRLALQAAADVLEQYSDGVWLVELAPLFDPALVPQTVAQVLNIREAPGESITRTLLSALKDKQMLIVLDNCEHLLDASARLVDSILRGCPKVKVMASSREGVGIGGEIAYRVPSLSVPDLPQGETPESLARYEGSALFIERALAAKTDFLITGQNACAIASICRRLDGIPLAIELAASRIRSLTAEELEKRLGDRFHVLTGGSRTALPRQQTLRALIDWSYDLLEESQKALLCRLSVFAGGWSLESAENVCSGGIVEEWETLDLLTSLADKSLVLAEDREGVTRYRLLETVRQYARDRLAESGQGSDFWKRHLDHFLALAEEAEPQLAGPEQARWLNRLETEHENLRSGLEWGMEMEDGGREGLRLASALGRFWGVRGYLTEGRERIAGALARYPARRDGARAKALNGAGNLACNQSDYAAARTLHEESLSIRRELGDKAGIAMSLGNLGLVASNQGDNAAARTLYEESLTRQRELGDKQGIAVTLNNLGLLAYNQGDNAAARTLNEESLTIRRELGDRQGIAFSLTCLGLVAHNQGDNAAARALYEESLIIMRELGDSPGIADSLACLGLVAHTEGDNAGARALQGESLIMRRELGDKQGIAASLEAIADLAAVQEALSRAATLWCAAEALREQIGSPLWPADRDDRDRKAAAARAALGEDAFCSAWEEGRGITMEEAVALALGDWR